MSTGRQGSRQRRMKLALVRCRVLFWLRCRTARRARHLDRHHLPSRFPGAGETISKPHTERNLSKPRTQASAKIMFTRYGVHIRLSRLPDRMASRNDALSTHCHHWCAQVNHNDMRCETRSSSSVTVVHGFAGTVMMGLTRSCMRPNLRRRW